MISILIPGYNEADNLDDLRLRLEAITSKLANYDFEFIFVDNGSNDDTKSRISCFILNDKRWKYIRFTRNFGLEASYSAGLSYASGEAVIIVYSDLQDPPELIEPMINKWEEGYDIVYAEINKRSDHNILKKIGSNLMHILVYKLSNKIIPKHSADFQLLSRKVVDSLNALEENNRYFRGLVHWTGFNKCSIPYDRGKRKYGKTKFGFIPSLEYALRSLIAFSPYPLLMVSYSGIIMIILSVVLFLVVLLSKVLVMCFDMTFLVIPLGWTSIVILILMLGGLNNVIIGVLGLYISNIYRETKNRPLFVIDEKSNL